MILFKYFLVFLQRNSKYYGDEELYDETKIIFTDAPVADGHDSAGASRL